MRIFKATLLVIIVMCIPLFGIFAFPTSLSIDMLNDGISFGIGDNPDDFRSYGASVSVEFLSGWDGEVELTGFTIRNNDDPGQGRRFDEILVNGGKDFSFRSNLLPNILSYDVSLQGGVVFAGNLGFSAVQNLWHEINGIEIVDLDYCSGSVLKIYPYFPLSHAISVYAPLPLFSNTNVVFKIENDLIFAPGYRKHITGALTLGHVTTYDKYFTFSFGFSNMEALNSWPLHSKVGENESGLFFKLNGRMGMLSFLYNYHFSSYKGYGGIGINLGFDQKNDHYYRTNDFILSIGPQVFSNMLTLRSRYAITSNLGIYLSNSFKSHLLIYAQNLRQIISKWHLGVDYQLTQYSNDWVLPYVSGGVGLKRVIVTGDSDGPIGERTLFADRLAPLLNVEIGGRFFYDGRFQIGSVAYGVEVGFGFDYSPTGHLQDIIDEYQLIIANDLHPRVKVALFAAGSL